MLFPQRLAWPQDKHVWRREQIFAAQVKDADVASDVNENYKLACFH